MTVIDAEQRPGSNKKNTIPPGNQRAEEEPQLTAKLPAGHQGLARIAPLFAGWEETMIYSCLAGCMGYAIVDDDAHPTAAQIVVGDFASLPESPAKR